MINKNINIYYYDLYVRYTNLSILNLSYYMYNIINIEFLKNRLPVINNMFLDEFVLLSRKVHLFIGLKNNLKNNYSYLGKGITYLQNMYSYPFFKKTNFFISINNYIFNAKHFNFNQLNFVYVFYNSQFNNSFMNILQHDTIAYSTISDFYDKDITSINKNSNIVGNVNDIIQLNIKNRLIYYIKIKRNYYNIFFSKKKKYISKYVKLLKNKTIFDKIMIDEFKVENVLYSVFNISKLDIKWFFNNNFIYLNGIACDNLNKIININDRIQLKINSSTYTLNRLNISILVKKRYKLLNFYKKYMNKPSLIRNMKIKKKFFLSFMDDYFDIPKFIEVDFSILTIFVLYKPVNRLDFNLLRLYYKSLFKFNLLNWKILY